MNVRSTSTERITIAIDRLRIRACHGVSERERAVGNDYEVSVSMSYPPALQAARTDDLAQTANYAEIVRIVKAVMATDSALLEHLCGNIRQALQQSFPLSDGGCVKVVKLLPPIANVQLAGASVTLTW